jgi:hypothetical protein
VCQSQCHKPKKKPSIWGWFIPPVDDDFGDGSVLGVRAQGASKATVVDAEIEEMLAASIVTMKPQVG